jgi:hypothetical protein
MVPDVILFAFQPFPAPITCFGTPACFYQRKFDRPIFLMDPTLRGKDRRPHHMQVLQSHEASRNKLMRLTNLVVRQPGIHWWKLVRRDCRSHHRILQTFFRMCSEIFRTVSREIVWHTMAPIRANAGLGCCVILIAWVSSLSSCDSRLCFPGLMGTDSGALALTTYNFRHRSSVRIRLVLVHTRG